MENNNFFANGEVPNSIKAGTVALLFGGAKTEHYTKMGAKVYGITFPNINKKDTQNRTNGFFIDTSYSGLPVGNLSAQLQTLGLQENVFNGELTDAEICEKVAQNLKNRFNLAPDGMVGLYNLKAGEIKELHEGCGVPKNITEQFLATVEKAYSGDKKKQQLNERTAV